jgi:hypothetical protein
LRPVDVAERDVVDRRKGAGREGFERADVDFAHRFAAAGADRGQVAGGDQRQFAAEFGFQFGGDRGGYRRRMHGAVMPLNGLLQRLLLVFGALPGLALQHVARTDERNGADDAARLAIALRQDLYLCRRIIRGCADHRGARQASSSRLSPSVATES